MGALVTFCCICPIVYCIVCKYCGDDDDIEDDDNDGEFNYTRKK